MMPLLSKKEKIWYTLLAGREEGPFSAKDLTLDYRIDLDTLVWKEGFEEWKPIREVPELRKHFKAESQEPQDEGMSFKELEPQDEIALDMSSPPNFPLFWLLVALALATSLIYLFLNA